MRAQAQAKFPWICANLTNADGKLVFQPYLIKEIWGVKVGFLGLITPTAIHFAGARQLKVLDPTETARKWVPEIRKQADIVIVLSHVGIRGDRLMAEVPGIAAIIGGHSHTRIPTPVLIKHGDAGAFDLNATPIVQAYRWGTELGRLDLIFHRDASGKYHLMSESGRLIRLTKDIPEDPAIARMLDDYLRAIPKGK